MAFGRASNMIVIKQMLCNNVGTCNRGLIINNETNETADVGTKNLRFEISVRKDIARLRN